MRNTAALFVPSGGGGVFACLCPLSFCRGTFDTLTHCTLTLVRKQNCCRECKVAAGEQQQQLQQHSFCEFRPISGRVSLRTNLQVSSPSCCSTTCLMCLYVSQVFIHQLQWTHPIPLQPWQKLTRQLPHLSTPCCLQEQKAGKRKTRARFWKAPGRSADTMNGWAVAGNARMGELTHAWYCARKNPLSMSSASTRMGT